VQIKNCAVENQLALHKIFALNERRGNTRKRVSIFGVLFDGMACKKVIIDFLPSALADYHQRVRAKLWCLGDEGFIRYGKAMPY
jgi:hypothetical protein